MVYLVIMVIVAVAGITRLWLQQRKESVRMNSVDGFRESLEKIRPQHNVRVTERPARPAGGSRPQAPRRTSVGYTGTRSQPLDPARREAAKRRIEARRRARQSVA